MQNIRKFSYTIVQIPVGKGRKGRLDWELSFPPQLLTERRSPKTSTKLICKVL